VTQPIAFSRQRQAGAANLLITLVLSMSITLVTLAVAQTQLTEQRMSNNSHWHTRLSLEAQSQWSNAIANLTENFDTLNWVSAPDNEGSMYQQSFTTPDNSMRSSITLSRPDKTSRFIGLKATSTRNDKSGLSASFSQKVRILTVLTPTAESPPALVINGCITQASNSTVIRPINSDTDTAGESVRLTGTQPCPPFPAIDLHQGSINTQRLRRPLWSTVLTVSIEEFSTMAETEQQLPDAERRYSIVRTADLVNGRWTQSMGSPTRPVVVYFPPEVECPEFSPGVRIYGIVFIDSSCPDPIAGVRFEIFGSLVINGDLNASGAELNFNHIQVADDRLTLLNFPVLRSVKVPGSWRDF